MRSSRDRPCPFNTARRCRVCCRSSRQPAAARIDPGDARRRRHWIRTPRRCHRSALRGLIIAAMTFGSHARAPRHFDRHPSTAEASVATRPRPHVRKRLRNPRPSGTARACRPKTRRRQRTTASSQSDRSVRHRSYRHHRARRRRRAGSRCLRNHLADPRCADGYVTAITPGSARHRRIAATSANPRSAQRGSRRSAARPSSTAALLGEDAFRSCRAARRSPRGFAQCRPAEVRPHLILQWRTVRRFGGELPSAARLTQWQRRSWCAVDGV